MTLTDEGAAELSTRSRGTPRIANRLLRRVRDYAQVRANGVITEDVARAALAMLDVDQFGLDGVLLLRDLLLATPLRPDHQEIEADEDQHDQDRERQRAS